MKIAEQWRYMLLSKGDSDRLEATGRGDEFWPWLEEMRALGDAGSDAGLLEVWLKQQEPSRTATKGERA